MSRIRKNPPGVDSRLLVKDAAKLMPDPTRRLFLRGGASLGALAFLTGCDIIDGPSAEQALTKISYLNDRAQAWLFNPNKLAPTYPDSAVTRPFPFNAYYPEDEAPEVDKEDYKLEVGGMVDDKRSWTLDELYALSATGPGRRCASSSAASAPTPARNTSGSAAPRAIPRRSTCRPRCIRRRR
jgi:hypothetical protein